MPDELGEPSKGSPNATTDRRLLSEEELARLTTVYAMERQDDQYALVIALAIITVVITYIVTASAYLGTACTNRGCTGLAHSHLQLLIPVLPVALTAVLTLNVAASRMRSVHLQRLEEALRIDLPTGGAAPTFHTQSGLVFRPDQKEFYPEAGTGDRCRGSYPKVGYLFTIITFMAYPPILVILAGFTFGAITPGGWDAWKYLAAVLYGVATTAELAGFVITMVDSHFKMMPKQNESDDTPSWIRCGWTRIKKVRASVTSRFRRSPEATGEPTDP
ncbi:hypothetical protein [Streptomyces sp. NPDC051554]|uniref:hypothetical protein n=1 Tax=Streptomyces sp. NPDC051554 TaxID=3365656 RepID=UPI00378FC57C